MKIGSRVVIRVDTDGADLFDGKSGRVIRWHPVDGFEVRFDYPLRSIKTAWFKSCELKERHVNGKSA